MELAALITRAWNREMFLTLHQNWPVNIRRRIKFIRVRRAANLKAIQAACESRTLCVGVECVLDFSSAGICVGTKRFGGLTLSEAVSYTTPAFSHSKSHSILIRSCMCRLKSSDFITQKSVQQRNDAKLCNTTPAQIHKKEMIWCERKKTRKLNIQKLFLNF